MPPSKATHPSDTPVNTPWSAGGWASTRGDHSAVAALQDYRAMTGKQHATCSTNSLTGHDTGEQQRSTFMTTTATLKDLDPHAPGEDRKGSKTYVTDGHSDTKKTFHSHHLYRTFARTNTNSFLWGWLVGWQRGKPTDLCLAKRTHTHTPEGLPGSKLLRGGTGLFAGCKPRPQGRRRRRTRR